VLTGKQYDLAKTLTLPSHASVILQLEVRQ
jgi:hypothetical protein